MNETQELKDKIKRLEINVIILEHVIKRMLDIVRAEERRLSRNFFSMAIGKSVGRIRQELEETVKNIKTGVE